MKKIVLSDFSFSQRASNGTNTDLRRNQLFKKNFPKYLKKFCLTSKDGPTISQLKRTKVIQNLETSELLLTSKYWRTFLANKKKSVKVLSSSEDIFSQFPAIIRFLSNLHTLQVSMPKTGALQFQKLDKKLEALLKRSFRMINFQRNLQCLKVLQLSTNYGDFLLGVNPHNRFPKSLKEVHLSCQEKDSSFNDYSLLYEMLNNKNLARLVTNLDLGTLCYTWHYLNFKYLAKSVPNLLRLSFHFSHPNGLSKSIGNYLEACKNFEKLKSLEVNIANTWIFLKDFIAPPGIQHLKLCFHDSFSNETMLRADKGFMVDAEKNDSEILRIFEENEILSRFYENLGNLNHLESLEIVWNCDSGPNSNKYQSYFIQSILKRISSQTLQKLQFGHENIKFTQFELTKLKNKFNKLSTIKVTGEWDQGDENIGSFLSHLISLGDSIHTIKLQASIKEIGGASLISLLKQINHLEKKLTSKVNIELQIKFQYESKLKELNLGVLDLMKAVKSLKEEEFSVAKDVYLKLFTKMPFSGDRKKFLQVYAEKFKKFEVINSTNFIKE